MKIEDVQNYKVDRAGWGAGPWDGEPDRIDFQHAGFACLLLRNSSGAWCGYVGLPSTHPAYAKDYNDIDVECHGGLTYGQKCDGSHICHVPAPGESDDLFWVGFDCAHSHDVAPGLEARMLQYGHGPIAWEGASYRNANYARQEVERLAERLRELAEGRSAVDPSATDQESRPRA